MCGIAGLYSLHGRPLPPFDARRVLSTIEHRGPDDEGVFLDDRVWLGVRRLAIIDPEMGHQPVADEQGRFHLVMNGEVFDYDILLKQLQQRGHRFRSRCDTEVVLHLVEELWTDCLDHIDGQYAIAAYDARDRRFFLARDRMGICPLFYAQVGEYLLFASEMKALFATGLVRPAISRRALDAVLAFGCMPAPGAIFEGIYALRPGELLEVRGGSIRKQTSYLIVSLPDKVVWQNFLSVVRLQVWTPRDDLVNVKRSTAPEVVAAFDVAAMNLLSGLPLFTERSAGGTGYVVPS